MDSPFARHDAVAEMDAKAKPPGSLGILESWAIKLAALQQTLQPKVVAARLIVFAADHGVTKSHPHVSAYPRETSTAVFRGIASGGAASTVLCAANDATLFLVDVGLDAEVADVEAADAASHVIVLHEKIRPGSQDMVEGPAMSEEEVAAAEGVGRGAVDAAVMLAAGEGAKPSELALCIGELGIGNTTAAAALVAALTGTPPTDVCGRGTGINSDGLQQKIETVTAALAVNAELIASGPAGALRAVAGLEIAAMVGAYLQAAKVGIPVIVDGFISGAAALVAVQLEGERVRRCLFWSHRSEERGVGALLDAALSHSSDENGEGGAPALGERPPLDMGLRLGEGTGAVLALPLLRSAAAVLANMATLKDLE